MSLAEFATHRRNALIVIALIAVPVAAISDWLENLGIAATLDHFQNGGAPQAGDARRISIFSLIKWITLSVVLLAYSSDIFRKMGNWRVDICRDCDRDGSIRLDDYVHYSALRLRNTCTIDN